MPQCPRVTAGEMCTSQAPCHFTAKHSDKARNQPHTMSEITRHNKNKEGILRSVSYYFYSNWYSHTQWTAIHCCSTYHHLPMLSSDKRGQVCLAAWVAQFHSSPSSALELLHKYLPKDTYESYVTNFLPIGFKVLDEKTIFTIGDRKRKRKDRWS